MEAIKVKIFKGTINGGMEITLNEWFQTQSIEIIEVKQNISEKGVMIISVFYVLNMLM